MRQVAPGFFEQIVRKNKDISKSANSIETGPIFIPSLGQDLSRNAFVVPIIFPGAKLLRGKDFFVTQKFDSRSCFCSRSTRVERERLRLSPLTRAERER